MSCCQVFGSLVQRTRGGASSSIRGKRGGWRYPKLQHLRTMAMNRNVLRSKSFVPTQNTL